MCKKALKGKDAVTIANELELAERVSDKILCIRGDFVDRFGRAEEIFQTGYILSLIHICGFV